MTVDAVELRELGTVAEVVRRWEELDGRFAGMIRALLDLVLKELRERGEGDVKVVATGGSVGNLPKAWLGDIHFDPDLLLRGLEVAWRRQAGKGEPGTGTMNP